MTTEPRRFTEEEMLRLARGAVAKIDRDGIRGVTLCSADEIAAMAGALLALGLRLHPGPQDAGPPSERIEG